MLLDRFLHINTHKICWNEYGTSNGKPVFYFHGAPGSRLEAQSASDFAKELGIHLIAPDRPGYGDSTPQENFGLLEWPDIIKLIADELNLKHFSIIGFSGGGPYALACADKMPGRIQNLALAGCPASFETQCMQQHVCKDFKPLYELAVNDIEAIKQQLGLIATSSENILNTLRAPLPGIDKEMFEHNDFYTHYLKNLTLAFKNGISGIATDLKNLATPWPFDIKNIKTHVNIWHGTEDINIGLPIAKFLATQLPNNSLHTPNHTGHYLLFSQWEGILSNAIDI